MAEWKQTENNRREVLFAHSPRQNAARIGGGGTGSGSRPPSRTSSSFRRLSRLFSQVRVMRMQHWWFTAPLRLRSILRGRRLERELDEELQFHLEHKIEDGIAHGLSPDEARYATTCVTPFGACAERRDWQLSW
jgi:hypothetical protein